MRPAVTPEGATNAQGNSTQTSLLENQVADIRLRQAEENRRLTDYLEDGINVYFIGGVALTVVDVMRKHLITPKEMMHLSGAWNFFDGLVGLALGSMELQKARQSQYKRKKKIADAIATIVSSCKLNLSTALSILSSQGVLGGSVGAACGPLGGIGFAACMWLNVTKIAMQLIAAIEKSDPVNLLRDRLDKISQLQKQVEKAGNSSRKATLARRITQLSNQARALYAAHKPNDNHPQKSNIEQFMTALKIPQDSSANDAQQRLSTFLINKQHKKVLSKTKSLVSWSLAAAGMTFLAVSFACPPLLIPGLVLTGAAAFIRTADSTHAKIKNFFSRKKNEKSITSPEENSEDLKQFKLSKKQQRQYHTVVKLRESEQSKQDFKQEFNQLFEKSPRQAKLALKAMYQDMLKSKSLQQFLNDGTVDHRDYVSDKDAERIAAKRGLFGQSKSCDDNFRNIDIESETIISAA